MNKTPIETFSEVLGCLMLAEFGSIEAGVTSVSEKTGIPADVLCGYLTGDVIPRPETAAKLASAFETTKNPIAEFGLISLAANSLEFAMKEDEESEKQEQEAETSPEASMTTENSSANFSAVNQTPEAAQTDEKDQRISELQAKLNQIEQERELERKLNALNAKAQEGVSKGWLPPMVYKAKFESLNTTDHVAAFSSICKKEKVNSNVKLYALNEMLNVFESCGRWQMMQNYS
ncbi:MAG: hypothetical protein D6735_04240, partial [Acidobacteria bacterium]